MLLSEFTPIGLFELSGEEPIAERIYLSMISAHGQQFDMTPGESRQEAWCFATALSKGCVAVTTQRAGAEGYAATVNSLLARRESEYGIVPPWDATFSERQAAVAARRERPGVWNAAEIEDALEALLGSAFIAYRPTPLAEVLRWPTALGDQPQNLQRPTVTRKLVRLLTPISINLGVLQTVTYELVDDSPDLVDGDTIVVEPEVLGITETVENIRVGSTVSAKFMQCVFDTPHTAGALCSTAPYPRWFSSKRHNLVVVTPAASVDPLTRARIHSVMRRMVRAPSTWDIVESADGVTTGDFLIGVSPIGAQTLTSVTI